MHPMHEPPTSRFVVRLLLATTVGAVLGGGGVWLLVQTSNDPPAAPSALTSEPHVRRQADATPASTASSQPSAADRAAAAPPTTTASTSPSREDASLISATLRAFAESEIAAGWREVRADEVPTDVTAAVMQQFTATVRSEPRALGKKAAEARKLAEAKAACFAGDDLVALLTTIRGDEPEALELVRSERFARLLAPRGGGGVADGTRLQRGEAVADGTVLTFPAGVFPLPDLGQATRSDWAYPKDVVVRGAGMDATLLFFEEQTSRGPMQRFAIENCTVFAGGLTDLRADAPANLSLRNVRVIGFDTGAGGSVALYLGGGSALLAVSCRFEGGYGRHPTGYANLLRVQEPCLAHFENCVMERCSLGDPSSASVLFAGCSMVDMLNGQPTGPTFQSCSYTTIPAEKADDPEYRRRDLNQLFPDWQRRLPPR